MNQNKTLGGVYNMQERFAIRKTLKKVAAIGTSVAMLGMSLTGALAQSAVAKTLADYPNLFTGSDAVIVWGSDPNANADNAAATDISFGLGQSTATASGSTTAVSTGPKLVLDNSQGYRKDVLLGTALNATTALGNLVREVTFPGLKKGTVTIAHSGSSTTNTYAWHEEITFPNTQAAPSTGLTLARPAFNNSGENFKDNIFLHLPANSMVYEFKFEENLKNNNLVSNSSVTDPLIFDFLGKTLIVESGNTNTDTSLTAISGDRFSGLHVGDSVVVDGKKVMVEAIGTSSAAINVDGSVQTIDKNNQRSFTKAGVQVRVEELIATGTSGEGKSSLTLIVGKETAIKTYNDGDNYITQNKNSPTWVWNFANLSQAVPTLQVVLNPALTSYSAGGDYPDYGMDHPPYVGDLLCLPNNYACLTMDAVTQSDDSFGAYRIYTTTKELYSTASATTALYSGARVLVIEAVGQSSNTGLRDSGGTDTSAIYLYGDSSGLWTFRKAVDSSKAINASGTRFLTLLENPSGDKGRNGPGDPQAATQAAVYNATMFSVNYKSTNFPVDIQFANYSFTPNITDSAGVGRLKFNPSGNNNEFLVLFKYDGSNRITFLGQSQGDTTKAFDVAFRGSGDATSEGTVLTDLSGYKEKTRTPDGIVIDAYDKTDSGDEVKFWVPPDVTNYKVWVKLARPQGSESGGVVVSAGTGPSVKKDTDVLADLANWNVVSVGGPAVNQVTARLLGVTFPTYGPQLTGLKPNEAVVELKANGNKWALLAYGWEADNTRAAGLVLRNYKDFAAKLKGTSVVVKHTSLAVSGITVE